MTFIRQACRNISMKSYLELKKSSESWENSEQLAMWPKYLMMNNKNRTLIHDWLVKQGQGGHQAHTATGVWSVRPSYILGNGKRWVAKFPTTLSFLPKKLSGTHFIRLSCHCRGWTWIKNHYSTAASGKKKTIQLSENHSWLTLE